MHQLILLRHAKAVPATADAADHDRPLTTDGRRAATAIGQAMRVAGLAPDVVLLSSSRRTQQTHDMVEAAASWGDRPNIDILPNLYLATRQQIEATLRALPETVRSALIIGHNPGLHELAQSLAGQTGTRPDLARMADAFPTAALAEFLVTTAWRKLSPAGATLQRFLQPADL